MKEVLIHHGAFGLHELLHVQKMKHSSSNVCNQPTFLNHLSYEDFRKPSNDLCNGLRNLMPESLLNYLDWE